MALQGTFYGTTANSTIKPKITWSAVQSVAGNYSDITATLSYSRTNSGYTTDGKWNGSLSIGSNTKQVKDVYLLITQNSNTVAITHTARVYHDGYGALSLTISATGEMPNASLKDTKISQLVTLDTIARASEISAADAEIESVARVSVARKNQSFTHSIGYAFGSLSGYLTEDGGISETEEKFTETTVNFLLPESFYAQIPNAPSGECKLTCRTYSGADKVGENTCQFTATASKNLCAPEVTGTVKDSNPKTLALTGDETVLIRYHSVADCHLQARAKHGASIDDCRIGGVVGQSRQITAPESGKIRFSVTDSRGYEGGYDSENPMVEYLHLTNNATVKRTDPTGGNGVLTLMGSCYYGSFGAENNTLQAQCTLNGQTKITPLEIQPDNSYYLQIPLSGLDYTRNYNLQVSVSDALETVSKQLTVHKGIPVFDWGENDFAFHVPVAVPSLTVGGRDLETIIRTIIQGG